MSALLKELNAMLSTELDYFQTAFCRDAIYSDRNFNATCKYNFALRRWCEEHNQWHVLPARKRRPWRLVSDAEQLMLEHLAADTDVTHLDKAMWDMRAKHAELFEVLAELEANALKARREQKRLSAKTERAARRPPRVAAEFIPRTYLIEFATCYRKVQYESEQYANDAIYANHRNEMERMNVYRCNYCKKHHVGHRSRRKPSPGTLYKHAKKYWRDYPKEADRFATERNLLLG